MTVAYTPREPVHYAIADDYEYNRTHKRERLSIWSQPFASQYEGEALSIPGAGADYMVTLYPSGDKIRVETPLRRDDNYAEVDKKISAAINDHLDSRALVAALEAMVEGVQS
jgi:hypothetical protein